MTNLGETGSHGLSNHDAERTTASPLFTNLQNTNYDQIANALNQSFDSYCLNQTKAGAGTSSHNNQQHCSRSSWAWRKRENDRAYREKQRQLKTQMKSNLESLGDENDELKAENSSLKQDNIIMNEILKSQAKEIDQFKSDFEKSKHEYNKKDALIQRLTELIAAYPDLQLENQRLKYENAQLRQNASQDHRISQFAEEIGRLKLENRVLSVQKDALCGKLTADDQ